MTLQAQNLVLERGGRLILADVSFAAAPGEFIALIGPNGAGKSSLLNVLAGLAEPTGGRVLLEGRDLPGIGLAGLARRRAYLPQNPRCEWPIPVARLVALGLTPLLPVHGDLGAEDIARVEQQLVDCDLTAQRDQAVTTLSGGELARAMLARALVGGPQLLLIDEPLAGLDPRHAIDTVRRLRALADGGTLVIAAMHDLTLALRHATRVIALGDGRVHADGAPGQALDEPLLRQLFGVEARVRTAGGAPWIDVSGP
jgi:iron complex transport system ATP-binding protein